MNDAAWKDLALICFRRGRKHRTKNSSGQLKVALVLLSQKRATFNCR